MPGGSSGGPAAAVACGFTSFELGTDIGGSIRMPSHYCGAFGLKPSFGVVSQRGYLDHVGGGTTDADINVFGPIARQRDDLDLLLGVLAGPDADRAAAWRLDLPPSTIDELAGARVAVWFDEASYPIDGEYRAVLDRAVDANRDGGCTSRGGPPPIDMTEQVVLFMQMISSATRRAWTQRSPSSWEGRISRGSIGRSSGRRSGRGGRTGSQTGTCCYAQSRHPPPSRMTRAVTSCLARSS